MDVRLWIVVACMMASLSFGHLSIYGCPCNGLASAAHSGIYGNTTYIVIHLTLLLLILEWLGYLAWEIQMILTLWRPELTLGFG
jgi:hypothetical protein